ncbi:antiterminator LoaP [Acetivibrio clariflavus]|uniref:antiterminator LoaP n=1 Tax=Acetivibrio clariflavus TaxID=288965 RepID=UPI0031F58E24
MYWYVLFVKAGKERKVEQYLRKQLNPDISIPFIPLQEILFRRSGTVKREIRFLFPGYVFIESILSDRQFIQVIKPVIAKCSDIISLLKYSNTEISMKESEKNMLINLCNSEYCIEASYGVIEGDRIHIIDGPLKGMESIVRKVNRHKREAQVEIEIMGEVRLVTVALEVVEKVACSYS